MDNENNFNNGERMARSAFHLNDTAQRLQPNNLNNTPRKHQRKTPILPFTQNKVPTSHQFLYGEDPNIVYDDQMLNTSINCAKLFKNFDYTEYTKIKQKYKVTPYGLFTLTQNSKPVFVGDMKIQKFNKLGCLITPYLFYQISVANLRNLVKNYRDRFIDVSNMHYRGKVTSMLDLIHTLNNITSEEKTSLAKKYKLTAILQATTNNDRETSKIYDVLKTVNKKGKKDIEWNNDVILLDEVLKPGFLNNLTSSRVSDISKRFPPPQEDIYFNGLLTEYHQTLDLTDFIDSLYKENKELIDKELINENNLKDRQGLKLIQLNKFKEIIKQRTIYLINRNNKEKGVYFNIVLNYRTIKQTNTRELNKKLREYEDEIKQLQTEVTQADIDIARPTFIAKNLSDNTIKNQIIRERERKIKRLKKKMLEFEETVESPPIVDREITPMEESLRIIPYSLSLPVRKYTILRNVNIEKLNQFMNIEECLMDMINSTTSGDWGDADYSFLDYSSFSVEKIDINQSGGNMSTNYAKHSYSWGETHDYSTKTSKRNNGCFFQILNFWLKSFDSDKKEEDRESKPTYKALWQHIDFQLNTTTLVDNEGVSMDFIKQACTMLKICVNIYDKDANLLETNNLTGLRELDILFLTNTTGTEGHYQRITMFRNLNVETESQFSKQETKVDKINVYYDLETVNVDKGGKKTHHNTIGYSNSWCILNGEPKFNIDTKPKLNTQVHILDPMFRDLEKFAESYDRHVSFRMIAYNGSRFDHHILFQYLSAKFSIIQAPNRNVITKMVGFVKKTNSGNKIFIEVWDPCTFTVCSLKKAAKDFNLGMKYQKTECNHDTIQRHYNKHGDLTKFFDKQELIDIESYNKNDVLVLRKLCFSLSNEFDKIIDKLSNDDLRNISMYNCESISQFTHELFKTFNKNSTMNKVDAHLGNIGMEQGNDLEIIELDDNLSLYDDVKTKLKNTPKPLKTNSFEGDINKLRKLVEKQNNLNKGVQSKLPYGNIIGYRNTNFFDSGFYPEAVKEIELDIFIRDSLTGGRVSIHKDYTRRELVGGETKLTPITQEKVISKHRSFAMLDVVSLYPTCMIDNLYPIGGYTFSLKDTERAKKLAEKNLNEEVDILEPNPVDIYNEDIEDIDRFSGVVDNEFIDLDTYVKSFCDKSCPKLGLWECKVTYELNKFSHGPLPKKIKEKTRLGTLKWDEPFNEEIIVLSRQQINDLKEMGATLELTGKFVAWDYASPIFKQFLTIIKSIKEGQDKLKEDKSLDYSPALRAIGKLLMNGLSGKMCQRNFTEKLKYFSIKEFSKTIDYIKKQESNDIEISVVSNNGIYVKSTKNSIDAYTNPYPAHIGHMIYSNSRSLMWNQFYKRCQVFYSDTDSALIEISDLGKIDNLYIDNGDFNSAKEETKQELTKYPIKNTKQLGMNEIEFLDISYAILLAPKTYLLMREPIGMNGTPIEYLKNIIKARAKGIRGCDNVVISDTKIGKLYSTKADANVADYLNEKELSDIKEDDPVYTENTYKFFSSVLQGEDVRIQTWQFRKNFKQGLLHYTEIEKKFD